MNVSLLIREAMMATMMSRPPQWPLLSRRARKRREYELKCPAGFVAAMRKISVIPGRQREHPKEVHPQAQRDGLEADAGEQNGETGKVHQSERNAFS